MHPGLKIVEVVFFFSRLCCHSAQLRSAFICFLFKSHRSGAEPTLTPKTHHDPAETSPEESAWECLRFTEEYPKKRHAWNGAIRYVGGDHLFIQKCEVLSFEITQFLVLNVSLKNLRRVT
jgi:hypothetical protein